MRTQYQHLESWQLCCLFGTSQWFELSGNQRLDACQEMENRLADARGTLPRQVDVQPMRDATIGYQMGGWIVINQDLLEDGVLRFENEHGDQTFEVSREASNWEVLETVFHEDMHGAQEDFGLGQSSLSYITSEQSPELYRMQPDEKQAFEAGQQGALAVMAQVESHQGYTDSGRQAYERSVQDNSYDNALATAREIYQDERIDQTLEQVIRDREQGEVRIEASESYRLIQATYAASQQQVSRKTCPEIDWQDDEQSARSVQRDVSQAPSTQSAAQGQESYSAFGMG